MKKVFANWTYTPKDYFKEEILIKEKAYSITIKDGKVELIVKSIEKDDVIEIHSRYNGLVESFFMVELFNKRKTYELRVSSLKSQNEDGTFSLYLRPKSAKFIFTPSLKVSFKKFDKDGNIVVDSEETKKKKQVEFLKSLQSAINKDDKILDLFTSYKNSISDQDDELVHLYEIRDGLHSYFGSHANAVNALNLDATLWRDFGRLCNDPNLLQGRHRGKKLSKLRNATEEELKSARELAIKMIKSFITHLNNKE